MCLRDWLAGLSICVAVKGMVRRAASCDKCRGLQTPGTLARLGPGRLGKTPALCVNGSGAGSANLSPACAGAQRAWSCRCRGSAGSRPPCSRSFRGV